MPAFVPHAALAKLLGTNRMESSAATVGALIDEVKGRVSKEEWDEVKRAAILVNGVAMHRLEGLDTPLAPDDTVWMVVPSGGG
jgi:molybdopterin converting factor small subunit